MKWFKAPLVAVIFSVLAFTAWTSLPLEHSVQQSASSDRSGEPGH
ncbi:hypothetical protein C8P63_10876 [Melghirimyces profundicolus]|uniref:Uncharacterized protein n=1 Tax=Melghirimyces profundicolus TaxID=1242148 RepID=A0A2T6BXL0_9BACL|nr:hypothetical protein [Melghirimyces profundicolus]PTX60766.1 hypothetical protein C8P63_10876 [Melghirimyces profundicolus]